MSVSELQAGMEDLLKSSGFNVQDLDESFTGETTTGTEPAAEPASVQFSEPQQAVEPAAYVEPQPSSLNDTDDISDDEFNGLLTQYVSERLGVSINSLDELSDYINREPSQPMSLDERVAKIADFVANTGRSPEDWFKYQQLNPTEMDDLSAIKLQTMVDYPNLAPEQIDKLVNSRYKLNEDLFSDEEIELSKIQLKIDADKARSGINDMRESYMLPIQEASYNDDAEVFDEQWISTMAQEVDALDGMEFELGDGKSFTFGFDDRYKQSLKEKNAQLDRFFDPYVDDKGNWDFESLSMHRALVDNIDTIAKAIYQQGLSDGQRNLVSKAANVQAGTPGIPQGQQTDSVLEQLKQALGAGNNLMTFR
jgi:hypothetical protein